MENMTECEILEEFQKYNTELDELRFCLMYWWEYDYRLPTDLTSLADVSLKHKIYDLCVYVYSMFPPKHILRVFAKMIKDKYSAIETVFFYYDDGTNRSSVRFEKAVDKMIACH